VVGKGGAEVGLEFLIALAGDLLDEGAGMLGGEAGEGGSGARGAASDEEDGDDNRQGLG
jgi:hypothetical protein